MRETYHSSDKCYARNIGRYIQATLGTSEKGRNLGVTNANNEDTLYENAHTVKKRANSKLAREEIPIGRLSRPRSPGDESR